MIDLTTLENAFADIAKIGSSEETFHVDRIPITVRPLRDEENIHLWKFAAVALEKGDDAATQQEWMHRMKVGTLAHALVQVGDIDLREAYISTGKQLESGKPILREKFEVVRELVAKWPSALLLRVFARYGEFISRVELEAEEAVELHPVDFDSEIQRLQERIEELQQQKRKSENDRIDPMGKQIRATMGVAQHEIGHRDMLAEQAQKVIQQRQQRGGSQPEPEVDSSLQPDLEPSPPTPQMSPSAAPAYTREQIEETLLRANPVDPESSFVDPSDPDVVAAVQREQAHLFAQREMRRRAEIFAEQEAQAEIQRQKDAQAEQRQREAVVQARQHQRQQEVASHAVTSGRKPAHLAAARVQQRVAEDARQVGVAPHPGGEMPVYQLPTQVLSARQPQGEEESKVSVNQPITKGTTNPKFQPPRR